MGFNIKQLGAIGTTITNAVANIATNQSAITALQGSVAGLAEAQHETLTVATNNQTAFTLAQAPTDATSVRLEINGLVYRAPTHFSLSGTALTWLDAEFNLETTDVIHASYR